jgi:hypothetical protein
LLTSLLSSKLAAAAAAGVVALGGVTAAAYAGVLPASVQKLAHNTLGAPVAHANVHPSHLAPTVGTDVPGPAAYGLCTAYAHQKAQGSAADKAVAFRNLAAAAGGAAKVRAYCAAVPRTGENPPGHLARHRAEKPATHPSHSQASHPNGKPASHPSGKPTNSS